jgi:carbonic anhydrase
MTTRRQFIQSVSAAGVLLATSGRLAQAAVPAMTKGAQAATTPDKALQMLKEGNKRFVSGRMHQRDLMAQVKATASGQYPFAVVIGCIDSRVPPELVFDLGIGDIFSPRIAGNFVNTDIIGSTEFATRLAGAKLILVLGHTECGAVKGACDNAQLGNLTHTLSNIMPAVYSVSNVSGGRDSKNAAFVQKVAEANVRLTVEALTDRSGVLQDLVAKGNLKVAGAMHDVATGRVTFYS